MKKIYALVAFGIIIPLVFAAFSPPAPATEKYIVIAWNDLGMHCANQSFANMCILPPYNNQSAQVVKVGTSTQVPVVVNPTTSSIHVNYSIPGNTYSGSSTILTKTDFWKYVNQLFGVNLLPNIGLTGAGLSGSMGAQAIDYYQVQGIPVTPLRDNNLKVPDPYQLTLIKAFNSSNQLLASTQSVIPVSNEINCVSSGCHSSEMDILRRHDKMPGFDINKRPIFCAKCHADNALGMPGKEDVPSFSEVIHLKHAERTNDCYKCHPGPITKCFRDVMHAKGLTCQKCHGSVLQVGKSVEEGRRPWLDEPKCGSANCHGSKYAEQPGKLYRESKGHGGLFCSACHGSPHAILPTENVRDNVQNIALQGFAGTLKKCEVCHGYVPTGAGPHGYHPKSIEILPVSNIKPEMDEILANYPNPATNMTTIPYHIAVSGNVKLELFNIAGAKTITLVNQVLQPGEYTIDLNVSSFLPGTYVCILQTARSKTFRKIIISK